MPLNHISYLAKFRADHQAGVFTNDIENIVKVERSAVTPCFRCIGVHHLTPDENARKRNIYLECVNAKTGNRLNEFIEWGWEGMRPWENPGPVVLDKPAYEPGGNISVDWGQKIWVKVLGKDSDRVSGLTTQLPDEGGGNTLGHHSYYVVFAYVEAVEPPPVEPPPPAGDYEALRKENEKLREENANLRSIIVSARDMLDKV